LPFGKLDKVPEDSKVPTEGMVYGLSWKKYVANMEGEDA
jgi:hypothetical protein